ncbi:cyclic-phosphate processing receiver domain-containing protein [Bacteroides acidifaciens]|uniref:cyclic-phosphate processing receiver domain-containing protein n=1 Tax=Bacteroides acidifaciens TaxID=85831 RepID=UPI00248B79B9|nr:cyclic-phosphate processing receiver domain-containing protein [Bacteroides acidifaciens]
MKIWVDDIRPVPNKTYVSTRNVNNCIKMIGECENANIPIELIDLDHDAGIYSSCGGDYIKILDWLEATGRNYPIRIHSMNPVGVENMRRIIRKNEWTEII